MSALAASANDGCEVRTKNEAVLHEVDPYSTLQERDSHSSGLRHIFGAEVGIGPKTFQNTRDADYLTSPIKTVEQMRAAERQAADLEKKGQARLAQRIRQHITSAANSIYGHKLDQQQAMCLTTAEKLRQAGWRLFARQDYPPAEKSYRGVLEIYEKELGRDTTTADAMGELARVLAAEGKSSEAQTMYERAAAIYRNSPDEVEADAASLLESYGEFLSLQNQNTLAEKIYAEARAARQKANRKYVEPAFTAP